MVRIIIAAVLAIVVAFSAVATAQQTVRASRWQPDQFGPIVPTDTMWSIAGYYSRQQGVSLHEMMDRIVATNPRAFRDNRPDFMLTGFFLDIPELGQAGAPVQSVTSSSATEPDEQVAATETQEQGASQSETESAVSTNVENEIAISVSELQALRTQLSDSIDLIENLQGENSQLQERLAAVTRELNELRARADVEQQASTEMELIAQELSNKEATNATVSNEPSASNMNDEPAVDEPAIDEPAIDEPGVDEETAGDERSNQTVAATVEPSADATPVVTTAEQRPVVTKRKQESWLDWLLKPLHLLVLGGTLIILLGGLAYALYVRRVNREIEQGGATDDTPLKASEDTKVTAESTEEDAEEIAHDSANESSGESSSESSNESTKEWQESGADDGYAEVTDVDLDAYLRERDDENHDEVDDALANTNDDDDLMSQEVNDLLAMEFPSESEESDTDEKKAEPEEPVAEYRESVPESESVERKAEDERARGELDEVLDSFGGLRLDEDNGVDTAVEEKQQDTEHPADKATDDEDYLSIESLMEEAETEASEEQDDPYNKEKLSGALGGDDVGSNETDLSTESMLDESKSPAAKLDLAQVYIDMGEVDDARELLESIAGSGDEEAERDAAELLKKLAEQGGR